MWQQMNLDVVHVAEHEVLACDDGGPVQHIALVLRDERLPVGALGRREVHADHPVARRVQVRAQRHHCALVVHVVELRLELVDQTRERELLPSCAKTNVILTRTYGYSCTAILVDNSKLHYSVHQGLPDLVGSRPKNLGLKTTKGPNSKF